MREAFTIAAETGPFTEGLDLNDKLYAMQQQV